MTILLSTHSWSVVVKSGEYRKTKQMEKDQCQQQYVEKLKYIQCTIKQQCSSQIFRFSK